MLCWAAAASVNTQLLVMAEVVAVKSVQAISCIFKHHQCINSSPCSVH